MKRLKNVVIAATLLVGVGVADSQAGLIKIDGGLVGPTPVSNGIIDIGSGVYLGNLYLDGVLGTDYLVEFVLIGSESGYVNTLVTPGGNLTEPADQGETVAYTKSGTGSPSLLDFSFTTPGHDPLVNGANNFWNWFGTGRAFFVAVISPDELWVGLDDSGGTRIWGHTIPDKDYNDWVGKLKVSPKLETTPLSVPDAGSALPLLGVALAGLGMMRRRFS